MMMKVTGTMLLMVARGGREELLSIQVANTVSVMSFVIMTGASSNHGADGMFVVLAAAGIVIVVIMTSRTKLIKVMLALMTSVVRLARARVNLIMVVLRRRDDKR